MRPPALVCEALSSACRCLAHLQELGDFSLSERGYFFRAHIPALSAIRSTRASSGPNTGHLIRPVAPSAH
jgi:hypothetical protein